MRKLLGLVLLFLVPTALKASLPPPNAAEQNIANSQEGINYLPEQNVRFIVTLNHDSVLRVKQEKSNATIKPSVKSKLLAEAKQDVLRQQERYLEKLNVDNIPVIVHRRLNFTTNQVVLTTKYKHLPRLRNSSSVKRVTIDRKVTKLLDKSVKQIEADALWQVEDTKNQFVTGKGVRVAIIDTGIDYTHSDLGNCLGTDCKVLGGIDIVNGDNDPMDDEGHGTHVAGIVAANGAVKGVAPDASLYAIKVLGADGAG